MDIVWNILVKIQSVVLCMTHIDYHMRLSYKMSLSDILCQTIPWTISQSVSLIVILLDFIYLSLFAYTIITKER